MFAKSPLGLIGITTLYLTPEKKERVRLILEYQNSKIRCSDEIFRTERKVSDFLSSSFKREKLLLVGVGI